MWLLVSFASSLRSILRRESRSNLKAMYPPDPIRIRMVTRGTHSIFVAEKLGFAESKNTQGASNNAAPAPTPAPGKDENDDELTHYRLDRLDKICLLERSADFYYGRIDINEYANRKIVNEGKTLINATLIVAKEKWEDLVETFKNAVEILAWVALVVFTPMTDPSSSGVALNITSA